MVNTDFIDKYDMLPHGTRVLCAVSGGRDSMYLLCRMLELAPAREMRVSCAHFDHMLRGDESARDREFVENWCARSGVPCFSAAGDVAAFARENGLGAEEAARTMRYHFLEKTAGEQGADVIATAHTADDNAETVLLNLTRGTGLRGLCGIPPVRGRIIRPVLDVTRAEIDLYLEEHSVPSVEDSTNSGDDYSRNRVRHSVIPVLRGINPELSKSVLRSCELLRRDEEYLSGAAREFLDKNLDGRSLPAAKLRSLPRSVSSRVVRMAAGTELSAAHVAAVLRLLDGPGPGEADVPGLRLRREYDTLTLSPAAPAQLKERTLIPGERAAVPEAGMSVVCELLAERGKFLCDINNLFFNYENICGKIIFRSRREGDCLRIAGRGCSKPVKKLFSEAKLTRAERAMTPVIADERGVIGVFGAGVAERCATRPDQGGPVLKIERMRDNII